MQEIRLTPASFIVLGLLSWTGEATPYRLKQLVASSVGFFWSLQHAQLYTEPERLARAGYVSERREEGGRRRKLYELTDKGREALANWRAEPTAQLSEVRDLGLLKLFFGAEPAELADVQLAAHRAELAE
jgi:PadR family transcriptional regulator, regulatory protein AphA